MREIEGLERHRARQVVDADQWELRRVRPGGEVRGVVVVRDVQIAIGDHRAATIPPAPPHDADGGRIERVRRTHDRSDVEIVREVLDRDVERVTCEIEVGDDRLDRPVAIPVHDVAPIAVPQELGIEPRVVGPGQLVRTYADALGPGGVRPGGDGVRLVGRIGIRLGHGPRVRASKITM